MNKAFVGVLALVISLAPAMANAAGLRLVETDNAGQGQAHAVVAGVTDASSVYYNPAAMVEIGNYAAKIGMQIVDPANDYNGNGVSSKTANQSFAIPHVYIVKNFSDKGIAVGLGLFANFGTGTNWPMDGPLRYVATDTQLHAATFNVNVAKKFGDKFSAAIGIDFIDSQVQYDSMYPFPLALSDPGIGDGITILEGKGYGFGYNVAFLYKPTEKMKVGLSYRSKVTTKFTGDITIENFASFMQPLLAAYGVSGDDYMSPVEVEIEYPDMLQIGIAYMVTDRMTVELDIDYTGWSSMDQLDFKFSKPLITPTGSVFLPAEKTTKFDWENVTAIRVGANYRYSDITTFRIGFYNDPSPVPEKTLTPRLPGLDRKLVSIGIGVKATDNFTIDVAFARLWTDSRNVDNDVGAPFASVDGEYKSSANIFGASVGYQF